MTMKPIGTFAIILAGAALNWGATAGAGAKISPLEAVETIILPAPASSCAQQCEGCGTGKHNIDTLCMPPCNTTNDTHDCISNLDHGKCSGGHSKCKGAPAPSPEASEFDAPEFWAALRRADGETLKAFLARNSHAAFFNPDRRALQFLGCGGTIIANIPLSEGQLSRLLP